MIEVATNPNPETLKVLLWVFVSLAGLLAVVVGWFILARFTGDDKRSALFQEQLDKMSDLIDSVKTMAGDIQTMVMVIDSQMKESQPRTEKRLNDHARTLKIHDRRITRVEERCKIKHNDKEEKEDEE